MARPALSLPRRIRALDASSRYKITGIDQRASSAPLVVIAPMELREQTADQQIQQVLNRLGFGARPGDVARLRSVGVDQWIALQLERGPGGGRGGRFI
jgi:hypothetical protein